MKGNLDSPASEQNKVFDTVVGSYSEEIPPNNLTSYKISEMAFESAFKYHPELYACYARNLETP